MHQIEDKLSQISLPTGAHIVIITIIVIIQQQRNRQRGPLALQPLCSRELRQ